MKASAASARRGEKPNRIPSLRQGARPLHWPLGAKNYPGQANETSAFSPVLTTELNLEATFDACGSSPEHLRQCVLACRRSVRRSLDARLRQLLASRGHDPKELCSSEVTASLTDLTLCDLLQAIAMGRKDAVVEVVHAELTSHIWCCGGDIVDAESGHLRGELAVYRIMAFNAGALCVDFRTVRRNRVMQNTTHALLLEAARRNDECAVLRKQLGSAELRFSRAPEASPAGAPADRREMALLDAFTPSARVDTVLANSADGDLETLRTLAALVTGGRLVPEGALASEPVRPAPNEAFENGPLVVSLSRVHAPRWRREWAGGVALLALGLSVVTLLVTKARVAAERAPSVVTLAQTPADKPSAGAAALEDEERVRAVRPCAPESMARTFPVNVRVDPAQAVLWLDGDRIARGQLALVLPRSGRTHELRIEAKGRRERTLLFRDLSPPQSVTLEPLTERDARDGETRHTGEVRELDGKR